MSNGARYLVHLVNWHRNSTVIRTVIPAFLKSRAELTRYVFTFRRLLPSRSPKIYQTVSYREHHQR